MANSTIEKLIDAGMQFTEMSKKQADAFVSRLVKAGELQRQEADRVTKMLIERGRETSERLAATVQAEVSREMTWLNERYDELEARLEELAERVGEAVPGMPTPLKKSPAKKAGAKKSAAKKTVAKKTVAKKTVAKKTAAKKAPAKKAAAKKAAAKKRAAKKAVGSSGVRKVSTSRNA